MYYFTKKYRNIYLVHSENIEILCGFNGSRPGQNAHIFRHTHSRLANSLTSYSCETWYIYYVGVRPLDMWGAMVFVVIKLFYLTHFDLFVFLTYFISSSAHHFNFFRCHHIYLHFPPLA